MRQRNLFILLLLLISSTSFAQLGIRAGVNIADQKFSFSNESVHSMLEGNSLTGFNLGLVYQLNPQKSGVGFETGLILTQKGGTFAFDKDNVKESIIKGYNELNYLELPINLRLKLNLGGVVSVFGTGGVYGAYALQGKTIFEDALGDIVHAESFEDAMERLDYGYSFGGGVEFIKKLQISAHWNRGLQKNDPSKKRLEMIESETGIPAVNLKPNKVNNGFSVTLTYQLW